MPSRKLLVPAIFVGILAFLAVTYFVWNYQKKLCYQKSAADFKGAGETQKMFHGNEEDYLLSGEFAEDSGMIQKQ